MLHTFHFLKIYFNIIIRSTPGSSLRFLHQKPIRTSHVPIRATSTVHLIFLVSMTRIIIGEGHRSLSSSLCSLLKTPFTSSLLGPNIFLRTLYCNTFNQSSSLNLRDQVLHSYKTTGKIIVLYTLTLWRRIFFF